MKFVSKKKEITFDAKIVNVAPKNEPVDVYTVSKDYHKVFVNDEEFYDQNGCRSQLMIVDIGCPRSLMGKNEYRRLRESFSSSERIKIVESGANEKFRFGPSRTYGPELRIEIPMNIGDEEVRAKFFVVDGENPILIGNDILEPLGAVIYTETGLIDFNRLEQTLKMRKTKGGHFVVPVKDIRKRFDGDDLEDTVEKNNVLGADAVMLMLLC